jgi:hypothetical protein
MHENMHMFPSATFQSWAMRHNSIANHMVATRALICHFPQSAIFFSSSSSSSSSSFCCCQAYGYIPSTTATTQPIMQAQHIEKFS